MLTKEASYHIRIAKNCNPTKAAVIRCFLRQHDTTKLFHYYPHRRELVYSLRNTFPGGHRGQFLQRLN
jgi:hypothetical protein